MFGFDKVLHETQTTAGKYTVVERQYEGRPARVLFSGDRRAAQSGIGLDDNPELLFDYNQRCLELASNLYPKRILVLGGGAYTLPTALVTALPDAEIDVVELDGDLEKIARKYFGLRANPRLHIHTGDARQFVTESAGGYDMIIVDVFNELEIPRQFLTMEWVTLVYGALSNSGVVAMNMIASVIGRNTDLMKSQTAAYNKIFNELDVFPAAHGLTGWLPQNLILTAQKKPVQELKHFIRFAAIESPEAKRTDILRD